MKQYFAFQWHITDSCDQRCEHCYIFSEDNHIPLAEMAWDDMLSVIKNCEELCEQLNRIPYFYVTGGDPILHKDFWRLLELLKSKGIAFSIMGNPFHLTEEVYKRLHECGCERYQLSIDGLRETHDQIRKPGSFDTTLEKIACIRKAGIRSVIMTTVSGTNITEIPAIIDLAVEHHVDVFAFARYCLTSSSQAAYRSFPLDGEKLTHFAASPRPTKSDDFTGTPSIKSTHIEPDEYRQLLDVCWQKFEQYKDSGTTFNLKDHLWTLYLHDRGIFTVPGELDDAVIYDGCNCAINHLTILPDGHIYACRRMDSVVGNVFRDRLSDVFVSEKMDQYRDFEKFEKCSKCELMRFCRGCPAVAYGYTHNSYSSDPQCWKVIAS